MLLERHCSLLLKAFDFGTIFFYFCQSNHQSPVLRKRLCGLEAFTL